MEELRNLERVQITLSFMETQALSANDRESDRFIANFLIFMVQPFGALDMQKKCHLIYELLDKVSSLYLDAALKSVVEEGVVKDQNAGSCRLYPEYSSQQEIERISYDQIFNIQFMDKAVIKLGDMQRANSTIEDFCRSYFMFHGLDITEAHSIFMFFPVLYFTESYIYQLDTLNEKQLLRSTDVRFEGRFRKCFTSNPFNPLIQILQQQGLLTERIRTELYLGVEYWKLERKLCSQLTKKDMIMIEDVMRAIQLKSFDYRVLNLLLYQLRSKPVNELHMEFLSVSEFLVEVSDDLYDYEEDVIDNTFNILRMFVGIYGASKAPVMLAKYIIEAEEKYDHLSRDLNPELSCNFWRRYEEATSEGCSVAGHVVGKWTIPSIIENEELFRSQAIANQGKSISF